MPLVKEMLRELIHGIVFHSVFDPRWGLNFNHYLLKSREGLVWIDPLTVEACLLEEVERIGNPEHVILTQPASAPLASEVRKRYGARIYVHQKDADLLDQSPDETYSKDDVLPGNMRPVVIPLGKGNRDVALHIGRGRGIVYLGGTAVGWPTGELSLVPEESYDPPAEPRDSLKVLMKYDFDHLALRIGEPLLVDARGALARFFLREEVFVKLPVTAAADVERGITDGRHH